MMTDVTDITIGPPEVIPMQGNSAYVISSRCVPSGDRAVQMRMCPVDRQCGARPAASPAHPQQVKNCCAPSAVLVSGRPLQVSCPQHQASD